ncbi:MAG: hypothetical protein ACREBZ_02850 [Thermoplasmata archaeon]
MTAELVPRSVESAVTEQAIAEARQALVRLLDHDLAVLRLGAELGLDPMEVARRSVRISLTSLKEDEKPVTLVVAESEQQLHEAVQAVRSPSVYRYKTIARPVPVLPEAASEQERGSEPAQEPESHSSQQEESTET